MGERQSQRKSSRWLFCCTTHLGSVPHGAKLVGIWDGFGVGFFTSSGSGFEKDFLANGTHFFEDGFELLVGSDSLFQKVGLFLRERQGDGFCFDLCCPLPVARVIGCHTSMGYPLQRG